MDGSLAAYTTITAVLVVTPGATTAVVVDHALTSGWRGGVRTAVGAALGNTTHATVAGLGAAVLLAASPRALAGVRLAGGLFLLWLAFKSARRLRSGATVERLPSAPHLPAAHSVRDGLVVNLLNPAIVTFYLTVVPSFLPRPAPPGRYVLLAAIHVGLAFVVHCLWAFSLHRLRSALERPGARRALDAVTTCAMLILAARVLWSWNR